MLGYVDEWMEAVGGKLGRLEGVLVICGLGLTWSLGYQHDLW